VPRGGRRAITRCQSRRRSRRDRARRYVSVAHSGALRCRPRARQPGIPVPFASGVEVAARRCLAPPSSDRPSSSPVCRRMRRCGHVWLHRRMSIA
jgi:hypothetical protein